MGYGFRLNVILPGCYKTLAPSGCEWPSRARLDLIKTGYDFRAGWLSVGNPDEVAQWLYFFLRLQLRQGAVIPVDGGFLSS